jgi:1-acyl-sn-glycerol-3-phosphate acyltransferase
LEVTVADAVPAAPVVPAVMDVAAEPPAQLRVVGPDHIVPGPIGYVETWVRLLIGLAWVGVCSVAFVVVLFFCLPSRATRVKVGNVYGSFAGRGAAWLTGSRFVIKGEQYAVPSVPSIYVANHASVLDVFIGIWMSRTGTCGVAKKEIVYYPFLGQFFWLAGHLTIDRGNNARAVASLKHLVEFVTKNRLSIWIWPEGTRSKSGRLLPFKKGPFHLAVATKLPIVPVVIRGTQHAWPNRTFRLNRATVEIEFLPPISTSHWTQETMEAHIEELRSVYLTQLPADQLPIPDDEITAPGRKAA